jgi:hypothetical protein
LEDNKLKIRYSLLIIVLLIAGIIGGCGMSMFDKSELTERQCEILESEGFPTEWDELSRDHQKRIVEIEKRLRHLESKYNKKFCYNKELNCDNIRYGFDEIVVYAEGDNPKINSFMIKEKKGFFGYEDTYDWVLANSKAQKYVEDKLSSVMSDQSYNVYAKILGVDKGKATGISVTIILDDSDEEHCDELFENIHSTVKSDKLIEYITMYCVDTGSMAEFNEENYDDAYSYEKTRLRYYYSVYNKNIEKPDCEKERLH